MTAHDAANLMRTQLTMKTPPTSGPALNARKRGPLQSIDRVDGVPHNRIVYDRTDVLAYCRVQQPLEIRQAMSIKTRVERMYDEADEKGLMELKHICAEILEVEP